MACDRNIFLYPSDNITYQFIQWQQDRKLTEDNKTQKPKDFWMHLKKLIIRGEFEQARTLLEANGDRDPDVMAELNDLLCRPPILSQTSEESTPKQIEAIKHWKQKINKLLLTQKEKQDVFVCSVLQTLNGDKKALVEASSNWIELFGARLLLEIPFCQREELSQLADECLRMKGNLESIPVGSFDFALMNVFKQNGTPVVEYCENVLKKPWVTFHITYLITLSFSSWTMGEREESHTRVQRHLGVFLNELKTMNLYQPILWYIIMADDKKDQLSVYFKDYNPETELEALQILQTLENVGVQDSETYRQICFKQSQKHIKNPCQHINWLLKAEHYEDITNYICSILGKRLGTVSAEHNEMIFDNKKDVDLEQWLSYCDGIIDALSKHMDISNELKFLFNYRNMLLIKIEIRARDEP
eukprot:UN06174